MTAGETALCIHFKLIINNSSRYVKPLLTNGEDMLTLVRMDPFQIDTGEALADRQQQCRSVKKLADTERVLINCHGGAALDYLIFGCKAAGAVMLALDYPEETKVLLDYLNKRTDQSVSMCLEAGADFVVRRGWYDSADFWGPACGPRT
jgi:hypothetical protein